jgi:hypothetical protein
LSFINFLGKKEHMDKLRTIQLPFIILLSILLVILFFQYQDVVEENSFLKSKLSERLLVSQNTPKSIEIIPDNCPETYQNKVVIKTEIANAITEKNFIEVNEPVITEIETTQGSQNVEVVPFEDQEIDFEWATIMETSVSDAFQTSELLEKFTLENVECRSSICEVRMPKGQEDTFHQSVLVLFALDELGVKHKSLNVSPVGEYGTVVFYFSKNEI